MSNTSRSSPIDLGDPRGLECPVCHDRYRGPKILPCGHTLCLKPCLEQIANGKSRVRCPECRMEHQVPDRGVEGFLTNVSLARFLDTTTRTSEGFTGCPICGEDDVLVDCLHCGLHVCADCRHHHTSKLQGEVKNLFRNLKEDIATASSTICTTQKLEAESLVKQTVDLTIDKLDIAAKRAHTIIDDRTKDIRLRIEDFGKEEMFNIEHCSTEIQKNLEHASKYSNAMVDDLDDNVYTQAKLSKLKDSYLEKHQLLSQSKVQIDYILRQINVRFDTEKLEESAKTFATISVLVKDKEVKEKREEQESEVEVKRSKRISIIERDTSTFKLSIGSQGSGPAELSNPRGVAVDPVSNDIVVADYYNHRIQVFDQHGKPKLRFGSRGKGRDHFNYPIGVAVNNEGHIFISDCNNYRVKIHSREGTFLRMFGSKGGGPGCFDYPRGITLDQEGLIHVCDSSNKRVQVFDQQGTFKHQYDSWKTASGGHPCHISISETGCICVGMESTLAVLDPKYRLSGHFTIPGTVCGVCWADGLHIVISDETNHNLTVYTSEGQRVGESGVAGFCMGPFISPNGVAMDKEGFIYVASQGSSMVYKF